MGCEQSRPTQTVTSSDVLGLLVPGYGGSQCDADLKRRSLRGSGGSQRMVDVNEDARRVYDCDRGRRALDASTLGPRVAGADDERACLDACLSQAECRAATWSAGGGCRLCVGAMSKVVCADDVGASKHWLKVDHDRVTSVDAGSSAFRASVGMDNTASRLLGSAAPISIRQTPLPLFLLTAAAVVACATSAYAVWRATGDVKSSLACSTFVLSVTVTVIVLTYL